MAKHKGLSFYQKKKHISSKLLSEILSWLFSVAAVIFLGIVTVYFFGMSSNVVGNSMEPELGSEQEILINRFSYVLGSPGYGDVVLFLPNGNEYTHYYTKRIVGRPGDTIVIRDGIFYVNDIPSEYVTEKILDPGIAESELLLGTGEYFVMGDNPSSSEDSRSSNIGFVKEEDIVGRVWLARKSHGYSTHIVK
jgi:signal peptidase I